MELLNDLRRLSRKLCKLARKMDFLYNIACLINFLLTYRSTPHTTTGVSPVSLFVGRELRTTFDLLKPDIDKRVCEKQSQQKMDHDKRVKVRNFNIGERVMVKNFRPGPNWVPGTITKQDGPVSFTVCVENGQLWKRHIDHIKSLGDREIQHEFTQNEDSFI